MEKILNNLILCKNEYYYYNNKIWERKNKNELKELLNNDDEMLRKMNKLINKFDIIKNSKNERRYIGFNNGIYDVIEKKLIENKDIKITSLSGYIYESTIEEVSKGELYDYLMICIYDVIVNCSNKYILECEKGKESIMISLEEIFGNIIQFINMENVSKKLIPRIMYYGKKVPNDIKYEGKTVIPIDELIKIDKDEYNKVFNNILNKYSEISEKKVYKVPKEVRIINRYNIEINEKRGRPKKYNTEEERKQAMKYSIKKWREKSESKAKIAKNSKEYYNNNKLTILLRNRLNNKKNNVKENIVKNVTEKVNKELSEQSKKTYEKNYERCIRIYRENLGNEYEGEKIKIKRLMEIMRNQTNLCSQRSILTALKYKYKCGLVNIDSVEDLDYETKRINDMMSIKEKKCKLSETQRKHFTSWYNILKVYNKLKELCEKSSNESIWTDYLLISYYVLIPPRRNELAYMYIGNEKEYVLDEKSIMNAKTINYQKIESKEYDDKLDENKKKINENEDKNERNVCIENEDEEYEEYDEYDEDADKKNNDMEKNLYIDKDGKSYLIFRRYKTEGTYRDQILETTKEFRDVINKYIIIKKLKAGDKLIDKNGDEITKRLNKIFNVLIKKKIGCSLLRHIFISHCQYKQLLETVEDRENLSKMMGHSVETQMKYYISDYKKVISQDLPLMSEEKLYKKPGRPKKTKKV